MIIITLKVCSLASGSSGNSIYIASNQKQVLVDAGLSGKKISEKLSEINVVGDEIDGILVTHEHQDHIKGVGILSRRFDVPIYATEKTWTAAEEKLGKIKRKNKCIIDKEGIEIGDLRIGCFSTPHDAVDPVGFTFYSNGKKAAIATDIGYMSEEILDNLTGAELVVLESNHDLEMLKAGPYPWHLKKRIMGTEGHLSNDDAAATVVELVKNSVKRILLAHLSKDNNVPELAHLTTKNMVVDAGMKLGKDFELGFAYREEVSQLFQVG
ncbi:MULTISPECIES: MBL fold metallo-hydrolase [unclassified Candidatus Frackibacter]|uniref:MBL fold metallo-hydrolase n=1 Tax=unclassified Candidatus Frackibacter TaxID=2648818 RepID=UPI000888D842|nr:MULTISPECIES: MBL fold metallo-hydrolase [unclassified Candidatus Frackibacter]SDC12650.1 Phosphoribosyl 1,2-cyclic phosphodiesterase [Candidatus Frackibacter sp. WG11]SEM35752.1 Phosphoribosyl 1,2-cyclic phosphodiesterase [Candidatus Frackibacter sp. WG12]SFL40915.1 Phosphoribosyl 1,2-cyclic phosphodiesterase [Candidatus Frackibacter sp. WG13]